MMNEKVSLLVLVMVLVVMQGCGSNKNYLEEIVKAGPQKSEVTDQFLLEVEITNIREVDDSGLIWIDYVDGLGMHRGSYKGPNHGLRVGDLVETYRMDDKKSKFQNIDMMFVPKTKNQVSRYR